MTRLIYAIGAVSLSVVVGAGPSLAQAVRFDPGLDMASASPATIQVQYKGEQGMQRHRPAPRARGRVLAAPGGAYRGRRGGIGAGVGAGIAGLAAGAIIGGVLSSQGGPGYGGPGYGGPGYGDPGYGGPVYGGPAYGGPAYGGPRYGGPDGEVSGPEGYSDEQVQDGVGARPGSDARDYCVERFRSYDPASGTYLGNDGERHPCP